MTQPAVNITELDGALGILPPSAGRLYALAGVASAGTLNTPATYGRVKDVVADFTSGPLVEAAAHSIERYGRPVVLVRTAQSATTPAGTVSGVTSVATGTSVVTITASPTPNDDYELQILFTRDGTRGTNGWYKYSLDGGRNYSVETALSTATSITIPGAGGVSFALAAGTFVAGDYHSARAVAPCWTSAELATALAALQASTIQWEIGHVVGPIIDGTTFDAVETKFAAMFAAGKRRVWIGNFRLPTVGESEASYLTAFSSGLGTKSTKYGAICFGATKLTSSVSGRKYKRPVAFSYAALEASVSEEVNTADVSRGAIVGVDITDSNGNPDEHNESVSPGGDDARAVTYRTHPNYPGVYVNRPRLFSPDGSDFYIVPHRRVINLGHDALTAYFTLRLNKPVLVSNSTGFILESEALAIEAGATAYMRAALRAKPKASAVSFVLSRFDNVLSTKTLTGSGRIVPLAYPEGFDLDVGFTNPALQIQGV